MSIGKLYVGLNYLLIIRRECFEISRLIELLLMALQWYKVSITLYHKAMCVRRVDGRGVQPAIFLYVLQLAAFFIDARTEQSAGPDEQTICCIATICSSRYWHYQEKLHTRYWHCHYLPHLVIYARRMRCSPLRVIDIAFNDMNKFWC